MFFSIIIIYIIFTLLNDIPFAKYKYIDNILPALILIHTFDVFPSCLFFTGGNSLCIEDLSQDSPDESTSDDECIGGLCFPTYPRAFFSDSSLFFIGYAG